MYVWSQFCHLRSGCPFELELKRKCTGRAAEMEKYHDLWEGVFIEKNIYNKYKNHDYTFRCLYMYIYIYIYPLLVCRQKPVSSSEHIESSNFLRTYL